MAMDRIMPYAAFLSAVLVSSLMWPQLPNIQHATSAWEGVSATSLPLARILRAYGVKRNPPVVAGERECRHEHAAEEDVRVVGQPVLVDVDPLEVRKDKASALVDGRNSWEQEDDQENSNHLPAAGTMQARFDLPAHYCMQQAGMLAMYIRLKSQKCLKPLTISRVTHQHAEKKDTHARTLVGMVLMIAWVTMMPAGGRSNRGHISVKLKSSSGCI